MWYGWLIGRFLSASSLHLSLAHTQSLFVALSSDVVDLDFDVSVSKLPKLYHQPQMSFTGRQSQRDNVNETMTVVCASIIYSLILLTLTSTTCLSSQTQETCLHLTGKSGDHHIKQFKQESAISAVPYEFDTYFVVVLLFFFSFSFLFLLSWSLGFFLLVVYKG